MNKEVNELLNKLGSMEDAPLIWINEKVINLEQENKQLKEQVQREVQVRDDIHNLLHSRWDELKKWLEEAKTVPMAGSPIKYYYGQVLLKIKELEEGVK